MHARRGHALFHAIVTMGAASVQACGGMAVDESHAGHGPDPGAGGNAATGTGSGNSAASSESSTGGYGVYPLVDASAAGSTAIGASPTPDAGVPADCAYTEQFSCAVWDPVPEGCYCVPNSPRSAADCPGSNSTFYCHSYTPQVGCYCTCVICIH